MKGFTMKRLIVVLSGLLVLPAFADITPISSGTTNTPVAQPSRAVPRGSATANRATSRVTPSTTSGVSARDVSTRNSQSSRNATTARTGVQTVERSATGNIGRVASRPSRNVGEMTENTVTTRRAMPANTNPGVTARVGMTTPMVANRVSSRSSAAIQARAPTTISVSAAAPIMIEDEEEQIITTTEEKQTAISNMDEIVQMTDYCKSQYTACMDNFCNVLDDNQGRCSCSKNIKNYEKTENALKAATEALQDVSQQIQYIGLTKDDIETLFSQTEAEIAMQSTTDSTQLKNDLDNIKDMIVGIKTGTASSSETGVSFDLSGLMDFNIDSTGFDLTALFAGNNANTTSISNQRGEQLYKTAQARCKTAVLNTCQAQGVDVSIITNSYDLEIDKQCIAYERSLTESNENMNRTVRNAKAVLQKARLMVAQQKNAYDLRGCVNALDSCMQDDFVCGTDYENCLDPSGKYIVNGEVVIGSTPGYVIKDDQKSLDPAPVQHTTGLYSTWGYGTDLNAWTADGSLIDYISAHIQDKEVTETSETLIPYLQYKIGYIKDNKAYGMCSSVLNKCQNYTYDKKKYKHDNQVIREYLQRTLTQIKVAQDEIINSYAENCISDVNSCLSSNNYTAQANYAINACKSQIVTCMSVNGDSTANPTPENVKQWVYAIQNPTEIKSLVFEPNGLSIGWNESTKGAFNTAVYNPAIKFKLPTSSETLARSSQVKDVGGKKENAGTYCVDDSSKDDRYWCYEKYKEVTDTSSSSEPQTELVCTSLTSGGYIPAGTKLVNGVITLSCNSKCIVQSTKATCP